MKIKCFRITQLKQKQYYENEILLNNVSRIKTNKMCQNNIVGIKSNEIF